MNYTFCFFNIILHYIVGGNKLIRGLSYVVGDKKNVTTTGPSNTNVLSLGKGQGGLCNSSKRYKILNRISAPTITWE